MRPKLILLLLLALSLQTFSQSKNTIAFVYAKTSNGVNIHGVIGDFGYQGKGGTQFGIDYTRDLNKTISLKSGLLFTSDNVELSTIYPGNSRLIPGNIKVLTIPAVVRVSFLSILFVDAGLLGDFETNYSANGADDANKTATKQTGIGFEFGCGAQYNFGPLHVMVNPFFQDHAVARFSSGRSSSFNLVDSGFKFGAGYSF